MSDYAELVARLRSINPRALYSAISKDAADAIEALLKRAELADSMHDVAVRERNYERAIADRLREELATAQKDADRYRWLRDNSVRELTDFGDLGILFSCDFTNWNDVDAAIDAAMQEDIPPNPWTSSQMMKEKRDDN